MLFLKQSIFAKNLALLINFLLGQGYYVSVGEVYRTPEMAQIYAKEHKGIMHSLHEKHLAVDILLHDKDGKYLVDGKYYQQAGKYWESLDWRNMWGGDFSHGILGDFGHFQMHDKDDVLQNNKYLTGT